MTVSDLESAERWYAGVFGGPPDVRPMDGLVEWHLGDAFGVQVFEDSERAGRSTMVGEVPDLDALVMQLDAAGIEHAPVREVSESRVVILVDTDGNQIVLSGPLR